MIDLKLGDCFEVMQTMPQNSVDSIVTDPPYGLSFMGKHWDHGVPSAEVWSECLRVLKPGGHLLAFAGTRTQHRMATAIEDAGFEIRDMIAWVYGSGFPKSHNLKDDWQGWGTALKPALEPITVARKPLIGTVAANVLAHGTGAINVDGCRVGTGDDRVDGGMGSESTTFLSPANHKRFERPTGGRWPANLIHDGSEEVVELAGSAARFFYCAKASRSERDKGCQGLEVRNNMRVNAPRKNEEAKYATKLGNNHPTVKPIDLMRYLCRLVTPPGGIVLDPFMGSGSTGVAAGEEEFSFVGIEREQGYFDIAEQRIYKFPDWMR